MKTIIRTQALNKEYVTGDYLVKALKNIDLQVEYNEYIAIMGSSGSGKSTLLNILGCLDIPTSGEYWLDGSFIGNMHHEELARVRNKKIGYIFQNFNLLPNYTALQNVQLPMIYAGVDVAVQKARATEALEKVNLLHRSQHKPNQLSGGERQRVAIARALINYPSIILADEPTGNLDAVSKKGILSILQEVHVMGNTLIIVTHDEKIAQTTGKVYQMVDGELCLMG